MKRGVLAATLAILMALVACVAVAVYAHGADRRAMAGQRAVRVLVARKVIPAGTTGQAVRDGGYTELVTMPAATVPADALGALDGGVLTQVLTADQQPRALLLRGAFGAAVVNRGGLPIPDGMLAVSVSVRLPAQVAGYVQTGSMVAVYDTFNVAEGKPGPAPAGDGLAANHAYDQATRLLLSSVQVLAIGAKGTEPASGGSGSSSGLNKGSAPSDGQTVMLTVAVTDDQARRLVHAAQTGLLYLALLGNGANPQVGGSVDNYGLFP